MEESIFRQVFPFVRLATDYVVSKFGVSEGAAAELFDGVLAGLLPKHPQRLNNPKRYFLRACRWKALKTFRRQGSPEAPEILVALEDNDVFLAGRKLGKLYQFFLNFGNATEPQGAVSTASFVYQQGAPGSWLSAPGSGRRQPSPEV